MSCTPRVCSPTCLGGRRCRCLGSVVVCMCRHRRSTLWRSRRRAHIVRRCYTCSLLGRTWARRSRRLSHRRLVSRWCNSGLDICLCRRCSYRRCSRLRCRRCPRCRRVGLARRPGRSRRRFRLGFARRLSSSARCTCCSGRGRSRSPCLLGSLFLSGSSGRPVRRSPRRFRRRLVRRYYTSQGFGRIDWFLARFRRRILVRGSPCRPCMVSLVLLGSRRTDPRSPRRSRTGF